MHLYLYDLYFIPFIMRCHFPGLDQREACQLHHHHHQEPPDAELSPQTYVINVWNNIVAKLFASACSDFQARTHNPHVS